MTRIRRTIDELMAEVAGWLAARRTHQLRLDAGEASDAPPPLPPTLRRAADGQVVRVCTDHGSALFTVAGPQAVENAVEAGYDAALCELDAEYRRGVEDGRRGYADAPTVEAVWVPLTDP